MFKPSKSTRWARPSILALISLVIGACATTTTRNTTSVVDYLYPNGNKVEASGVATLALPMRVGIAFVPGDRSHSEARPLNPNPNPLWSPPQRGGSFVLTEKRKQDLMQEVAGHFKPYPFIKEIEIIPSMYLSPRGSFANLDQIKTMYGVSAIVLLSYDQTQFKDEGALSIAYWTIVGAYVVRGEKNDTHTMLDAVVYDISSRKMLFRAPGTSLVKGRATPVNLSEQQRADAEAGFEGAAKEMIVNLDQQLSAFKEKVKERPAEYNIQASPEYRARAASRRGADLDAVELALLAALCSGLLWTRRRA